MVAIADTRHAHDAGRAGHIDQSRQRARYARPGPQDRRGRQGQFHHQPGGQGPAAGDDGRDLRPQRLSTTLTGQVAALSGLPGAIMGSVATLRPQPKSPPTGTGGPGAAARQPHGQVLRRSLRRRAAESGDSRLAAFASGVAVAYGGTLARILPQRRRRRPDPQPLLARPHHRPSDRRLGVGLLPDPGRTGAKRRRHHLRVLEHHARSGLGGWINVCGANVQERFAFGGVSGPPC